MSRAFLRIVLPVLFAVGGHAVAQEAGSAQTDGAGQEPTLAFPTEIEQVVVDVVVVDKDGQPVTDLDRSDFEVLEDGNPQAITSFEMFEVATPAPEEGPPAQGLTLPAPSRVSTNTDKDQRQGRTFVIVFDDVHLTAFTSERAKAAIMKFVDEETVPGDRLTLLVPGSGVFWNAQMPAGRDDLVEVLKEQEPLYVPDRGRDHMSEYEAMRIHNYRDNDILNRVTRRYATYGVQTVWEGDPHTREFGSEQDPYMTSKAADVYYQSVSRNHVTLGAIERALKSLVRLQGRKSLVLVSEGFIYDRYLPEFRRIVTASRRANTALYFLNSRGLEAMPFELSAEVQSALPQEDLGFTVFAQSYETAGGSESLAKDTGGFTLRNSNELAEGLKRIGDETRAYYLIGYSPANIERDGKFREIEVKIPGRKGVTIRARRGYYAPAADGSELAETNEGKDPEFQGALDSPYEMEGINLRMTHFVRNETLLDTAHVLLAAEVDVDSLKFTEQEDLEEASIEFLMVTISRKTGEFHRYDQTMDLKLPPETRELLSKTWLPIVRDFELTPGNYRGKLVVRDKTSGRISTVIHDFEVPEIGPFRVSTPVLSDMRETDAQGLPGNRLAIMARREFAPGASLYCQLDVYGAVKLASSGMPRVTMGYEVRRSDGTLYTKEPRSEMLPTEDGDLSRIIGFPLKAAPPGDYELKMTVKDELSGKTVEVREPFTVSATAAVPMAPTAAAPAAETPAAADPAATAAAEPAERTGR
jgi:VWFA-related protein